MKPLIGITMNLEVQPTRNINGLDQDYAKAVLQAGGIPVPVIGVESAIPEFIKHMDGFLFTGGDDIHPRFYKEKPLSAARMTFSPDERTRFEFQLFTAAVAAKKPVLAICHGAQLVNVAMGGTLYQDLPLQVPKAQTHGPAKNGAKVFHPADIIEGTRLFSIMGADTIRVRSAHHQCVKNPGRGLKLAAIAHDGVVEALESRGKNFLIAVQWHPEKTNHDRFSKKIFKALVDAAK